MSKNVLSKQLWSIMVSLFYVTTPCLVWRTGCKEIWLKFNTSFMRRIGWTGIIKYCNTLAVFSGYLLVSGIPTLFCSAQRYWTLSDFLPNYWGIFRSSSWAQCWPEEASRRFRATDWVSGSIKKEEEKRAVKGWRLWVDKINISDSRFCAQKGGRALLY